MTDDHRHQSSAPAGAVLAVFGAVLLLASLFLSWFEPDLSGWTAFEVLDLVLVGCALFAFAEALRDLGANVPGPGTHAGGTWFPGLIAVVIVLSQLANHPPAATGTEAGEGLWLALAAALLLLLAGLAGRVQVTFVGPDPGSPDSTPDPSASPYAAPIPNPYEREPTAATEPVPGSAPTPPSSGSNLWGTDAPTPSRTDPPTEERPI